MKLKLLTSAMLVVVAGLVCRASAYAQPSCPRIEPIDVTSLLLPLSCDGCAITKAELAELQALQQSRTDGVIGRRSCG
jgi:hypothetical protein